MYLDGEGVPQNFVRAHAWFNLAASNGNQSAVAARDDLAARMLPEQIVEAQGILCVNPGSPTYPHNYDTQFGTIGFLTIDEGLASASVHLITEDGIEPFDWNAIPPWKLRAG